METPADRERAPRAGARKLDREFGLLARIATQAIEQRQQLAPEQFRADGVEGRAARAAAGARCSQGLSLARGARREPPDGEAQPLEFEELLAALELGLQSIAAGWISSTSTSTVPPGSCTLAFWPVCRPSKPCARGAR